MVLGKLLVPWRPTIWISVGQGPTVLAVGAGGGCLDIFTLIYPFSPLSPSLWETARYRLKYCLKGPLNPKQPTIFSVKDKKAAKIYSWTIYDVPTIKWASNNQQTTWPKYIYVPFLSLYRIHKLGANSYHPSPSRHMTLKQRQTDVHAT